MAEQSAGILLYKRTAGTPQLFLVHPGGPFWAKKDEGSWTIPKGLLEKGEDELSAARREFEEETGIAISGDATALGKFRQPSGKVIHAWAIEGDVDPQTIKSNEFEMEWPPRSGRKSKFPEVDRAGWFDLDEARLKILKGQKSVIEAFCTMTGIASRPSPELPEQLPTKEAVRGKGPQSSLF